MILGAVVVERGWGGEAKKSRAAGTYGAAPGSGAGSDAALSPALAPGERITHLCTNITHMAEPRWKPGRGVGSQGNGLGQVCQKTSNLQGRAGRLCPKFSLAARHPAGRSPRTPAGLGGRKGEGGWVGWGVEKEAAEVNPAGCFPRLGAN